MKASWLTCVTVLIAFNAWAAPPDPTAQALFREGRERVAKGDWDGGCEQFRASNARFEAASTTLNLARCAEHFGKVATAWALYQRGRTLAGEEPAQRRAELERLAETGLREMEPRLSRLRIEVTPRVEGVKVEEAGSALPSNQDVPLDPGKHEIVVSASGYETMTQSAELVEGQTVTLTFALVKLAPVAPPVIVQTAPPKKPAPKPPPPKKRSAEKDVSVPTWIWVSSIAGVALTGAAVGFGLDASAQSRKLERKCGDDFVCNEDLSFDPGPTNARKNRDLGLAIGLGSAGMLGIGAAIFGLTQLEAGATVTGSQVSFSLGGSL